MNEKKVQFIRSVVDSNYFNINRLIKYLDEHELIGEEVFYYSCLGDWNKYWKLNERNGFSKINKNLFINRLPFYTYFDYVNKESINIFLEVFPKKFNSSMTELLYSNLEYLFYEEKLSVKEIIKYVKKVNVNCSLYDTLNNVVDYLKIVNKYELSLPKFSNNFIYYYNVALEKIGREPIIYLFEKYRETGKYFSKNNNIFTFNGYIPVDESGNPVLKWLGIKCKDVKVLSCRVNNNSFGFIDIEVNKLSIIKIFLKTIDGLVPQLVYTSPKFIIVDGEQLLFYRNKLNLTRREVFEITDISQKTLENWEKNNRNPNGSDLLKLISLYGISDFYSIIDINIINSRLDNKIEFGVF